jgi:hypothetical protein
MWRYLMKVDESTLQNILKAYGNKMKPRKNKLQPPIHENDAREKVSNKVDSEELDIVNYDKEGNVAIKANKKEALIDFFQ